MKRNLVIGLSLLIFVALFSFSFLYFGNRGLKEKNILAYNYPDDDYRVVFDMNGGEASGFSNGRYTNLRDGVYGLNNDAPATQPEAVAFTKRYGHNILYWSLDHLCSTRDLEVGASFDASSHKAYYACYEEKNFDNDNIRYIQEGAYVSGETVECGDVVHVTQCYQVFSGPSRNLGFKEYCDFDKIKRNDSSSFVNQGGTVYRNGLSNEQENNCRKTYKAVFHQNSVLNNQEILADGLDCGNGRTTWVSNGVCQAEGYAGQKVYTPVANNLVYNDSKFIGWAADDDGRDVNCSGKLVNSDKITLNSDVNYYACYASTSISTQEQESCSNSSRIDNAKGRNRVKVCYNASKRNDGNYEVTPVNQEYYDLLSCASGYKLDDVSKTNVVSNTCNQEGICSKTYELNCVGKDRPKVTSITNGKVRSDGFGTITFSVEAAAGVKGWFASSYYEQPTLSSSWIMDRRGTYSLDSEPGAVFLWGIDDNDAISYAAMASVIDTVNSDTTVKSLEIRNAEGENLMPELFADSSINEGITSSDYVRLSNKLTNDSKILASGFNPFDTAYRITTNSETISVYATLTSNDSHYVTGFEPRTVNLNYGVNTILLKIQDKNGKTRTYTIVVTREDNRSASNMLKNITVSEGKIKFDKYKTDYVVSVGKNKKTVNLSGELESKKATFVDGFGPRTIKLLNESTTAALKVQSETGSVRAYTVTFVKNGEETADSKTALLSSLSISKAYIAFDKNVYEYNTTVEFEDEFVDIYALAENGGDSVTLYRSFNGKTEEIASKNVALNVGLNEISIVVANEDGKTRTYSVNILRKENGLNISSDTKLSMLGVNGYDINFSPDKYDYEVKIKSEKTLVIAATPENNRSEVYIRGNDNLTAFSTVRVKVVAEDGQSQEYNIDIKKDKFNKKVETIGLISGVLIIICGIIIIGIKKKRKSINDYYAE